MLAKAIGPVETGAIGGVTTGVTDGPVGTGPFSQATDVHSVEGSARHRERGGGSRRTDGRSLRFIAAAKKATPQAAALYALALDTGARKSELCGLRWADVDLDAGRIIAEAAIANSRSAVATEDQPLPFAAVLDIAVPFLFDLQK